MTLSAIISMVLAFWLSLSVPNLSGYSEETKHKFAIGAMGAFAYSLSVFILGKLLRKRR